MPKRSTKLLGILLLVLLPLGAVSLFQQQKLSQCNRLVTVINEAANAQPVEVGRTIAEDDKMLLTLASRLEQYAVDLEMMNFTDKTLRGYQKRYVQLYRDISKASADLANAPITLRDVSLATRNLMLVRDRETPLVDEVNQYCR